jgi:hypothetical protein
VVVAVENFIEEFLELGNLSRCGILVLVNDVTEFREVLGLPVLGQVVGTVPVSVVRSLHGGGVTSTTSLMMPEFKPGEVNWMAELRVVGICLQDL